MYEIPGVCICIRYKEVFRGVCLKIFIVYEDMYEKMIDNFRLEHMKNFLHNQNVFNSKTYIGTQRTKCVYALTPAGRV